MARGEIHLPRVALRHPDGAADFPRSSPARRCPFFSARPTPRSCRKPIPPDEMDKHSPAELQALPRTYAGPVRGDGPVTRSRRLMDSQGRGAGRHPRRFPQRPGRPHQHDGMATSRPAASVERLRQTRIHLAARRPDQKIQHHPALRRHAESHLDRPAFRRAAGRWRGDLRFATGPPARPRNRQAGH